MGIKSVYFFYRLLKKRQLGLDLGPGSVTSQVIQFQPSRREASAATASSRLEHFRACTRMQVDMAQPWLNLDILGQSYLENF